MPSLDFSWGRRTPVVLQTEAAECGLACLAMVAACHGHRADLATLRTRHAISLKGSTLADLMRIAGAMDLTPRPLQVDLKHLSNLAAPCILHWDMQHFVVLERVRGSRVVVHDPAQGRRELTLEQVSPHFTGVALELRPTKAFRPRVERQRIALAELLPWRAGRGRLVAQILALAIALQVFALVSPFFMQLVVDHAIVSRDRDLITVLAGGFLLLALVQAGVTALRGWLLTVLSTAMSLELSSALLRHLLRLPMSWFDKRHTGDVLSRFESMGTIHRTLSTSFLETLIDGAMALATLALMLLYSVPLALVALTAALLYTLARLALYAPLRRHTEERIVHGARQHSHFLESVRGIQSLKLYGREEARAARWENLAVDEFNAGLRVQRCELGYQLINALLFGAENILTVWLGARLVLDAGAGSAFSIGMLFAFVAYKSQFIQRVAALVEKGLQLRMLGLHVERVGDILLATPETTAGTDLPGSDSADELLAGSIRLHGVSYRYGDAEPLVLDGADLSIAPGESVAIVGPSGGGKTTLVKLMLGLLTPTSGSIEFGGRSIARAGLAHVRGQVASVMQDDPLFGGSIAENIAFGDDAPDSAQIERCARLAAVHEDIVAMPMRYQTLVGDMGTTLSGGQKQRILLARALYRQPRILVLDEATSHLDVARERAVNDAVRALNLTRVIVAHRPETIASADRVVLLAAGRLQELRPREAGEAARAAAGGAETGHAGPTAHLRAVAAAS